MKLENSLQETAILDELGKRLSQRRIEFSWTQAELAQRAGIGKRTLERIEAGKSVQSESLIRILRELRLIDALDALVPESGPRPIDLIKLKGKPRQRASSATAAQRIKPRSWSWGDEK